MLGISWEVGETAALQLILKVLCGFSEGEVLLHLQVHLILFLSDFLGYFNDLWKYSERDDWVWMAGSDQFNQPNNYDSLNETYPGARHSSVMWIDSNDTLWVFGGAEGLGLSYFE